MGSHAFGQPIQAARFGGWKAVRNGTDKPIEIYDLATDTAESKDLSGDRPDLVARAEKIFAESHRADPHWPLDRLSEELNESRKAAWKVKWERDRTRWAPENSTPFEQ